MTPDVTGSTVSATAWINAFYDPDRNQKSKLRAARFPRETTEGVLTQNVRGFITSSRAAWMGRWQQRIKGGRLRAICIQETHVNSVQEAKELEALWARMWNLHVDPAKPISFWSVTETRAAGVGILLHPAEAGKYTQQEWTGGEGRGLLITSDSDGICNIYAPNNVSDRERFFSNLQTVMVGAPERLIVVGDFNCVLHPPSDRVTRGKWATGGSESKQLDALVSYWRLVDSFRAIQAVPSTGPEGSSLTYWHQGNGARLDRAYVTPSMQEWLVGAEIRPPAAATDHNGVVIWLRDPAVLPLRSPLAPLAYPIRGRDQQAIDEEVQLAISAVIRSACRLRLDWDVTSAHLREALRTIQLREKRRARRAEKKWRRRMKKHILTMEDVIAYERKCTERRLSRRRGARLGSVAGKSLLQRLADRPRHTITRLQTGEDDEAPVPADVMAAAWEPLLSHTHSTQDSAMAADTLFTIPDDRKVSREANQRLVAATTVEEVLETIKNTGAHKAAGDDRLNNDFFRDWGTILAPYLMLEFNRIIAGEAPPTSYGAAIIVPIPKNGNSPNPMDYRPIALLQSSYKIFTKLIARRLQSLLGAIINEDQRGFVRGRQMSDNIRIMQALLQQEFEFPDDRAESSPAILLIDFRKAYDTLDRNFLLAALRAFGFDDHFVTVIRHIYTQTTARFLVNGDLSRSVEVATGIRQGCPLAPLLFLIAVETLKYAVEQTPELRGIPLYGPRRTITHSWSAFVDDSVVFLETGAMLDPLRRTLQTFANYSGLHIQPAKSQLILLNPRCLMDSFAGFPVLAPGDTVRYLGVLIGLDDLHETNWRRRLDAIKVQLRAAARFISSIPDRVVVLNAVGIPSLLFTAKFFTPSPDVLAEIDQVWKQYLWQGTIGGPPLRAHHIAMDILTQHPKELGLGLQDPHVAMVSQAGRSVLEWNSREQDKAWQAMHQLLQVALGCDQDTRLHTFPIAKQEAPRPVLTGNADLLKLGWKMVLQQTSQRYPLPSYLRTQRCDCIRLLQKAAPCLQWINSSIARFTIPMRLRSTWADVATRNYAAMPAEIRSFWKTFPWANNSWIVGGEGTAIQAAHYPGYTSRLLGDLNLRYRGEGIFEIRKPMETKTQLTEAGIERLASWVWILIVNTSLHVEDSLSADLDNRVYSLTHHPVFNKYEWRFTDHNRLIGSAIDQKWGLREVSTEPDQLTAMIGMWGQPVKFLKATGSYEALEDLQHLTADGANPVILSGHPRINHGPVLLTITSNRSRPLDSSHLKAALRLSTTQQRTQSRSAAAKICGRLDRMLQAHPTLYAPLQSRPLTEATGSHEGLSVYQQIFKYRLLMAGLNPRGRDGLTLPCPHKFCSMHGRPADIGHVLWDCDAAKAAWAAMWAHWADDTEEDIDAFACLHPEAPHLGRRTRVALAEIGEQWLTRQAATSIAWNMLSTITLQQLWLIRNDACFRDEEYSIQSIIARIWKAFGGQLRGAVQTLQDGKDKTLQGDCLRVIGESIVQDPANGAPMALQVRLFYDGGARGNPGCSGAGSVLLEHTLNDGWRIVWWQATYCGNKQTNNYAEHIGVAVGLEECARRYGGNDVVIHVIGDSALVTKQLNGRATIRAGKLQAPFQRSLQALTSLTKYAFFHTRRIGNKMADRLANHAMDNESTITWTFGTTEQSDVTNALRAFLLGDCASPLSQLRPVPALANLLRRKYGLPAPPDSPEPGQVTQKKQRVA